MQRDQIQLATLLARTQQGIAKLLSSYRELIQQLRFFYTRPAPYKTKEPALLYHKLGSKLLNFSIPQPSTMVILTSDNLISRDNSFVFNHETTDDSNDWLEADAQLQPQSPLFPVDENAIAEAVERQAFAQEAEVFVYNDFAHRYKGSTCRLKFDPAPKIRLDYKPQFSKLYSAETFLEKDLHMERYVKLVITMAEVRLTESEAGFSIRDERYGIQVDAFYYPQDVPLPDVVPYSPPSIEQNLKFSERFYRDKAQHFMEVLAAYCNRRLKLIQLEHGDLQIIDE